MALGKVFDYFRSYDKRAFEVFACEGSEPSESDIQAFETEIGFCLPHEFREFTMSPLGGLYMAVREELWPRRKLYDVGPFWTFLYGLFVPGIADGIPGWLDVRVQYKQFKVAGFGDLVPFMQRIGDADKWCFDTSGQIVLWSHEETEKREIDSASFSDVLLREIRELEERKDRKISAGLREF